uniref:Uncharacterized protein n=1 Tax=Anguilla anguilla TaxID=7936 RepID=A0A0E9RPA8_ANGAN
MGIASKEPDNAYVTLANLLISLGVDRAESKLRLTVGRT